MDTNEWCAIAHIDFRPSFADRGALTATPEAGNSPSFEENAQILRVLAAAERPPGRWISWSSSSCTPPTTSR
jgi:hypothetical protein